MISVTSTDPTTRGQARSLTLDGIAERLQNGVGIVIDGVTDLEGEGADGRDHVECRPTADRAAVEGHLGLAVGRELLLQVVDAR